ncbi:MAG TPA: hypothetical protein VFF78_04940 [Anaerolineaceae bacterium]|nr:hypothetical protein [Anaerolineaceae bacterium]
MMDNLFMWTNEYDTVIAETAEQAAEVGGIEREDLLYTSEVAAFQKVADDQEQTLYLDSSYKGPSPVIPKNARRETEIPDTWASYGLDIGYTATAREWCEAQPGPCFWGSTEI